MVPKLLSLLLITLAAVSPASAADVSIGVNYGALADNLPPPSQVAAFLKSHTFIDRVKLFDCNPDFIRAFVGTGISIAITTPNGAIPSLATPAGNSSWIQSNVLPFLPAMNITLVVVGNKIMATADRNLITHLVPAMRSGKSALSSVGHPQIYVPTLHSLSILSASEPPSSGRFRRGYDKAIFAPMLKFHQRTKTPFDFCPNFKPNLRLANYHCQVSCNNAI